MSRNAPDADEIIRTVDEFVARIADRTDGNERYDALCARYLLAVLQRELAGGAQIDRTEHKRLEVFLGETGATDDLVRKLAVAIRSGACDARWEEVSALVFAHVVDNVSMSRPDQLGAGDGGAEGAEGL